LSNLSFKDHTYTLKKLLILRRDSPLYSSGEVIDLETGETLDISELDKLKTTYINELLPQKEKTNLIKKYNNLDLRETLEKKFKENTINKEELLQLIRLQNSTHFEISYSDFFIINCAKEKPKNISPSDYGRFMLLLDLMSYTNKIQNQSNGKKIKESVIMEKLEIKSPKTFKNLITKLSSAGMLSKNGYGDKRFIHINPAYAKRKIKIDETIYSLFKEDLVEFLTDYEIKYFELCSDIDITSSTLEIVSG